MVVHLRRLLVFTTALCFCWFTMDALLFFHAPSSAIRTDSARSHSDGASEVEELDSDTEPSAMLFEDILDRDRKDRLFQRMLAAAAAAAAAAVRPSEEKGDPVLEQGDAPDTWARRGADEEGEARNDSFEGRLMFTLLQRTPAVHGSAVRKESANVTEYLANYENFTRKSLTREAVIDESVVENAFNGDKAKTRTQQTDEEAGKAKASPSLKDKYVRTGNVGNLQADQVDPGQTRDKTEDGHGKTQDKTAIMKSLRFDTEKKAEAANNRYRRIRDYNVRLLPFDSNGPGEHGRPVRTAVFEQRRMEAMWNLSYFNQIVSDKIALERSITDTRHPGCVDKRYDYASLPTVSVIICFTDEWWSTLVRSVHSVLGRTPPELLREVILVDDFSQRQDLKQPLTSYLDAYPAVRLIRLPERYGLIRARMAGASEARAAVVVFLDSHVECNRGWLEPLLEAIRRNPKTVASPIIDTINAADFAYGAAPDTIRGGFAWNLQFRWRPIPAAETDRRLGDATAPIRTPTIAGGLFAVAREYFDELGRYDPSLDVWGSENIELSFKTWMCGGSLELIPCSRVGHVFRSRLPYSTPGTTETFRRNAMRVARVWMDAYLNVVTKYYPLLSAVDVGDLTDRLRLRERLGCRSFEWYLRNVYPELYVPSATPLARGRLHNVRTRTCADHGEGGFVQVFPCHGGMGSQYFQLAEDGRLEVFTECVGMVNGTLRAVDCNSPPAKGLVLRFEHREPGGPIVERATGLCVGIDPRGEWGRQRLRLAGCRRSRDTQKWRFDEYRNDTYVKTATLTL